MSGHDEPSSLPVVGLFAAAGDNSQERRWRPTQDRAKAAEIAPRTPEPNDGQPVQEDFLAGDGSVHRRASWCLCHPVSKKGQLGIEATATGTAAILTVFVTATGETIGKLPQIDIGKYKGQLSWPVNPQTITVKSDHGGASTVTVVAK